jgi:hypothetical protein
VSASLLLPGRGAQAQSDEDKAAARALATQGSEALKNGKFNEAIDLVSRAEAIVHAPTHLLMIARSQVGIGKLVSAQETYLKLMREELKDNAPAAFKNAQITAKEELAVIEPKIASLRIMIDGAGAKQITVKMDNQLVSTALVGVFRPVDPGKHEIGVFPVGLSPVKGQVELKDGEKKEIRIVIPDGPPPPGVPVSAIDNPDAGKPTDPAAPRRDTGPGFMTPLRGVGIGAGALGVAGVVVGALFMVKSGSTTDQVNTICGGPPPAQCPPSKTTTVNDLSKTAAGQKTIGAIGLIGGGVALAAGVTLLIVGKPKPAPAPAAKASVEPWFSGTAAGLRGDF